MADWNLERLRAQHERSAFQCGKPALDDFIRKLVSQYEKRRLGRTYVATELDQDRVAGYYTLAAGALDASCLASALRKKLPKHPIPTIHLGRLAVDQGHRGKRLGETLLFHALQNALALSDRLGAFLVDVWAIDDEARAFYLKYGFESLEDDSHHLYMPIATVAAMFP